jgi:hypothetical protein
METNTYYKLIVNVCNACILKKKKKKILEYKFKVKFFLKIGKQFSNS